MAARQALKSQSGVSRNVRPAPRPGIASLKLVTNTEAQLFLHRQWSELELGEVPAQVGRSSQLCPRDGQTSSVPSCVKGPGAECKDPRLWRTEAVNEHRCVPGMMSLTLHRRSHRSPRQQTWSEHPGCATSSSSHCPCVDLDEESALGSPCEARTESERKELSVSEYQLEASHLHSTPADLMPHCGLVCLAKAAIEQTPGSEQSCPTRVS